MKKPKLLCVSALPPPYHGTSIANDILLNSNLIQRNYDLKLVPLNRPKLHRGGDFSLSTLLRDLRVTFKLFWQLITFRPQLTYVGIAQSRLGVWRDGAWIWLVTLCGSKAFSHMHGGYFRNLFDNDLDGLTRKFIQSALGRLRGIIVLDDCLKYLFQGLVADERIFVLRNGIITSCDPAHVTEANQEKAKHQELIVTYLSNLVPGKGFWTFLEATALLKKAGLEQDFIFNLAGAAASPEIGLEVEAFVRTHRLENSVRILGRVIGPEKDHLLLNSDVFVFPTRYPAEGQPLVVIEALAAGLPVIATPRGAIPAMVIHDLNGFIVPEGDAAEIARRLKELRADAPKRLAMGAASRKIYEENYTAEKFVQGFAAILEKLIEKN